MTVQKTTGKFSIWIPNRWLCFNYGFWNNSSEILKFCLSQSYMCSFVMMKLNANFWASPVIYLTNTGWFTEFSLAISDYGNTTSAFIVYGKTPPNKIPINWFEWEGGPNMNMKPDHFLSHILRQIFVPDGTVQTSRFSESRIQKGSEFRTRKKQP